MAIKRNEQIAERARRAGHQIDRSMISKALADKLGPKPREATRDEAAEELWVDVATLEARLRSLRPAERAYLNRRLSGHDAL